MSYRTVSMKAALASALLFGAWGQAAAQEAPIARTAKDPQLKWGPCPPFLPKGPP